MKRFFIRKNNTIIGKIMINDELIKNLSMPYIVVPNIDYSIIKTYLNGEKVI